MIEVEVIGFTYDARTNSFIVFLREKSGDSKRLLPIWVGQFEAHAIAMKLDKKEPPRPMTHDLLNNIINALKAKVTSVEVRELRDATFYGQVNLEHKGEILKIDARPSDSIALALRSEVPIYVAEAVMEESGLSESELREAGKEQLKDLLKNLDEEQYGKYRV